jgi:uncharacterized protein (DUF58 family)
MLTVHAGSAFLLTDYALRTTHYAPMPSTLLEPAFLNKLEQLSLVSKKVFAGQLKGEKRSTRRGTSVEFADYRDYSAGDDLRYIDWNTYARLEKLFLKLFVEEEDLHVYLLLDRSQSMAFGSPAKLEYAKRVAAALGYIGLTNYDRVGASLFAERLHATMLPVRGRGQVFRFFQFLEGVQPQGVTSFDRSLREYALRTRRPGVVIVISDCFDPNYEAGLKALLYRKFQVTLLHVFDATELKPDFLGDLKLIDAETGEVREITVSPSLLRDYQRAVENFCGGLQRFCRRYGVDYIRTTTDTPFEDLILKYLRRSGLVR